MNNGFFGFPQSSKTIKVKQFDSSGIYVIPPGTESLYILLISGGAGGGGGRVGAVGTNRYGGGGGASGAAIETEMPLAALNLKPEQQLFVLIGSGGNGGLGGQTNDSNGSAGSQGTGSRILVLNEPSNLASINNNTTGVLFTTNSNALAGLGGTTTLGTGYNWIGGISYSSIVSSSSSGVSGNLGTPSDSTIPAKSFWSLPGLGGGGASISNTYGTGNYYRSRPGNDTNMTTPNYTTNSVEIARQTNREDGKHADSFIGGLWGGRAGNFIGPAFGGVGGGAGDGTLNGFNGGNGFRGSGGGGGGAATNGAIGGNGGKGGNGYALIVAYGVFS